MPFSVLSAQADELSRKQFLKLLSAKERAWLRNHKEVVYTGDPNWLPFEAFTESGQYIGIVADHIKVVEKLTGLSFNVKQTSNWTEAQQLAIEGLVDVISGDADDDELNKKFRPIKRYLSNRISVIMREDATWMEDLKAIANKRIAFIRGYGYTSELKRKYPEINFISVENIQEGLEKLSNGGIDAMLASTALGSYTIMLQGYNNLRFVGSTRVKMNLTLFVKRDKEMLYRIISKAFRHIQPDQQFEIMSRWSKSQRRENLSLALSPDERSYLKSISPVRFTGDPNWLPYEAFDEEGKYIGQVADHLKLIEDLLDIKFDIIQTNSWEESVSLARQGDVDMLSDSDDSQLINELVFTRSYTRSPIIIIMRDNHHFVDGLNDIRNKKIGLLKGYGYVESIRKQYPDLEFENTPSVEDGLLGVAAGRFDALLCNSAQAIFKMRELGLDNLRIAGKTEFTLGMAFAVHPQKINLVDILNKSISVIYMSNEQKKIIDKWTSVEYSQGFNYTLIYQILIAVLALLCAGLVWAYRISVENRRRIEANKQLTIRTEAANEANEAKSRFLAAMSHELRTPLHGILGMLELLHSSELKAEQRDTVKITRESSESLLGILNDILDISKIEANKIEIHEKPANIAHLIETCTSSLIQNAYDKGIGVEVYVEPVLTRDLLIDEVRLRQILNNLLSNAIKFTDEGKVFISAWMNRTSDKNLLIICVRDTGIGISKENQKKLFSEFFQVSMDNKRRYGGSGLGLNICRRLATLMGGEIELDSETGVGTTFTYQQSVTLADVEDVSKKWATHYFLLVNDNKFATKTISQYAHYYGGRIDTYNSLEVDIDFVRKRLFDEKYSVVFLDEPLCQGILCDHLDQVGAKIFRLVAENSLNANDVRSTIGLLNTNPLLPQQLEEAVDIHLGLADTADRVSATTAKLSSQNMPRILVAEDHPTNQILIREQLRRIGVGCVMTADGKEALQHWHREAFDGVLTDCHMPRVDGYELARAIRLATRRRVPIIAMTANALAIERTRCIDAGMDDLLVKPIDLQTLSKCIEHWFVGVSSQDDHLGAMEQVCFGRDNILPMLTSYWRTTENDIADLKQACSDRRIDLVKQIAHRMKGAAKIIAADELVAQTTEIERVSETWSMDELRGQIKELERAFTAHRRTTSYILEPDKKVQGTI